MNQGTAEGFLRVLLPPLPSEVSRTPRELGVLQTERLASRPGGMFAELEKLRRGVRRSFLIPQGMEVEGETGSLEEKGGGNLPVCQVDAVKTARLAPH